jgi:hypothetical protein
MAGSCCTHDALEWFAAIAPAFAAGAAAVATWKTAQVAKQVGADSLALQRPMMRPLLVVYHRHRILRGGVGLHWIVELQNLGQSSANIEAFRILVGGNEVVARDLEPPEEFWSRVMRALVDPAVGIDEVDGPVNRPPFAIPAREVRPLFDVKLEGDVETLNTAIRQLELDIEFSSPDSDERISIRRRVADQAAGN